MKSELKNNNGSAINKVVEPFDAMEKAIVEAYHAHVDNIEDANLKMIHEYPLGGNLR